MGNRIRHFVGVESSEQLAFIDELHKLGLSSTIELPELVVVGDQSTGKSSVLQAITEISFPVKQDTCTRFPVQISFRQTATVTVPAVKATITPGRLTAKDDAFRARTKDFCMESETLTQEVLRDMIDKATECIFEKDMAKSDRLSDAVLRIERSGPDEMHWSIVDLPGLIRNGGLTKGPTNGTLTNGSSSTHNGVPSDTDGAIAEAVVREYMQNERNIVLLVVDDVDVRRQRSLEIAQSIPGLQSRSIGVLSKCDKREEGSGEWMVSLLQNNQIPNVPYLDHGWFGIRNRRPIESHFTDAQRDEAEEREFSRASWRDAPKDRFGIRALMNYVDRERRVQLQKGMPQIVAEIRQKLKECEDKLANMGEARTSPGAQRAFLWQFCAKMQEMADAALRGRYQTIASVDPKVRLRYLIQQRLEEFSEAIRPTKEVSVRFNAYEEEWRQLRSSDPRTWEERIRTADGIYSLIYNEAILSRGTSLPGSVHPDVEETVFRKMSEHWERYARDAVEDAKLRVKECYSILLQLAIPTNRVRLEVSKLISRQLEDWNKDTDNALRELVEDNQTRPLFTTNPGLKLTTGIADELRNRIFNESVKEGPDPEGKPREGKYLSSLLNNVLQTKAKLETYYQIAIFRFIDNVATQVVERHVLGSKCPLRAVSFETFTRLDDDELNRVAGEDKVDVSTRQRLERSRDGHRKALARWEQLSVL
ncbi:putative dynamin family GTPase [Aspergillus foveolatus]|uniref:putative dynamin family GTPase n=1 Tax=Aspergillus foveolatus TaxID=210207 RepID=UPI003CCE2693